MRDITDQTRGICTGLKQTKLEQFVLDITDQTRRDITDQTRAICTGYNRPN